MKLIKTEEQTWSLKDISHAYGMSIEKVHEFFKLHFNYIEKVNEATSEVIRIPKSTTENTTTQQEEYHLQIREFLMEWFNVTAPLPNEHLNLEL